MTASRAEEPAPEVLVVDDDEGVLRAVALTLTRADFQVTTTSDPLEALRRAKAQPFDLFLVDMKMPVLDGMDVLRELRRELPDCEVLMMTAHASVESAVEAMKAGAADYLLKPIAHPEELVLRVQRAARDHRLRARNRELEAKIAASASLDDLIGQSETVRQLVRLIDTVARTAAPVLIQGERGTGKEHVARAIHQRSPRADAPFVTVNCSALTAQLLEVELFGQGTRPGLFEAARGGTLFLDEIDELPLVIQVRLLTVLQFEQVRRVDSGEERPVDVRLISASHRDIESLVRARKFREDLFYRIKVVMLEQPPLRERRKDIAPLAWHFLRKSARKHGKATLRISPQAIEALEQWNWPGNVRELESVIERAVVLSAAEELSLEELPHPIASGPGTERAVRSGALSHLPYLEAKALNQQSFERQYLRDLLRKHSGNISQAARAAGMDRSNFRRLMKSAGIELEDVLEDGPEDPE